jgi:hypothetical protein
MIEKKISYEINIEKPSKTKPVKQGGVFNYLGKQKTVNAPVKWRSSKDHPIAHLSYITKDEQKILIDLNLYGSLKGKPNRGPFGLPSLQGSGGGSEGAGSDSSGTGASEGTAQGDGPNEGAEAGQAAANAAEAAADAAAAAAATSGFSPDIGGIVGPGPGQQDPAEETAEETAVEAAVTAVQTAIQNQVQKAIDNPVQTALSIANPALGLAYSFAKDAYSNYSKGVTAPDDFSQLDTSVQSGPSQSPSGGGGLTTIPQYAPLYNPDTGNPTMDAYIRRLRVNLGLPV